MKRKIKRKLFLMGMAMMAGAYAPAYAKGGGKHGQVTHDYSATWSVGQYSTLPFDQTRDVTAITGGLLGKLKEVLGGLDLAMGTGVNVARRNGIGLQSFQPEVGSGFGGDPRLGGGYTGLALRISF